MELIDAHCHLTFEPLAGDVAAVVERGLAANTRASYGGDLRKFAELMKQVRAIAYRAGACKMPGLPAREVLDDQAIARFRGEKAAAR
jgi:Tat protein secretion system quality control protein TatD with DNase activity